MKIVNRKNRPPRSPLSSYLGGKMRLASLIIARMPEHKIYLEPFCGAAWVFFRKKPSYAEALNDYNEAIINFYEQLRDNLPALLARAKHVLRSRALFEKYKAEGLTGLDPIERAFRFWYIFKNSFGGRLTTASRKQSRARRPFRYNGSFITPHNKVKRPSLSLDLAECAFWYERLQNVCLEKLDWPRFMERYDQPEAFFYIDPPYYGAETFYGPFFCRDEYQDMAAILSRLKGKFLLSINDCPETRRIFAAFNIEAVSATYSINPMFRSAKPELFITNY